MPGSHGCLKLTLKMLILPLLLSGFVVGGSPAVSDELSGGAKDSEESTAWLLRLDQRIYGDWAPSKVPVESSTVVRGSVSESGAITNIAIEKACGDAQLDLDAVQAVLGAAYSTSCRESQRSGKVFSRQWTFSQEAKPAHDSTSISKYYGEHNRQASPQTYCFEYRIPVDVLVRYPQAFSADEILNPKNTIQTKNDIALITQDYLQWSDFCQKHPTATRKDIEDTFGRRWRMVR